MLPSAQRSLPHHWWCGGSFLHVPLGLGTHSGLICPSLPVRPQIKEQVAVNAVSGLSCCRERSWMRSQLIL